MGAKMYGTLSELQAKCGHWVLTDLGAPQNVAHRDAYVQNDPCDSCKNNQLHNAIAGIKGLYTVMLRKEQEQADKLRAQIASLEERHKTATGQKRNAEIKAKAVAEAHEAGRKEATGACVRIARSQRRCILETLDLGECWTRADVAEQVDEILEDILALEGAK